MSYIFGYIMGYIRETLIMGILTVNRKNQRKNMFYVDKALLNPNIPRTVRFTSTLFDWTKMVSERGYVIQPGCAAVL